MSTIITHHNPSPTKYAEVSNEIIEMSSLRANSELLSSTKLYENNLPPYDKALGTRNRCLKGLLLSYVLSITLIICGVVSYVFAAKTRNKAIASRLSYSVQEGEDASYAPMDDAEMFYPTIMVGQLSTGPKEVIILAFNAIVTVVTECLGYIHSVSLRWALYHENRLDHNSNLRLFTSARRSPPNSWYANVTWVLFLTVSYSCASQVLLNGINSEDDGNTVGFNSLAILLLGVCLFTLSLLTTWTLSPPYGHQIVSWNSDPLNTTLSLLHSTWTKSDSGPASIPVMKQLPIRKLHPGTYFILAYLWFLVPIICTGGAVLIYANRENGTDWAFINSNEDTAYIDVIPPTAGVLAYPTFWQTGPAIQIFVVAAIQLLYTLALHTVEQLVNLHRDEASWRAASKLDAEHGGAVVGRESTKAAFTAWQTVMLSILKPVSHWLFGLSFVVEPIRRITVHPMPLFALAGIAALLAIFATILVFHRPKGAQPATYGDLRMLADLVDNWGDGAGGQLFWGDKGNGTERGTPVKLAGTSAHLQAVEEIKINGQLYTGIGCRNRKGQKERES
jgi:hypothetical protein